MKSLYVVIAAIFLISSFASADPSEHDADMGGVGGNHTSKSKPHCARRYMSGQACPPQEIKKLPATLTCGNHSEVVKKMPFKNSANCTFSNDKQMVTTVVCKNNVSVTCDPCAGNICPNGETWGRSLKDGVQGSYFQLAGIPADTGPSVPYTVIIVYDDAAP